MVFDDGLVGIPGDRFRRKERRKKNHISSVVTGRLEPYKEVENRKRNKFRMREELSICIVSVKCFGDIYGEKDVQLASSNLKYHFKHTRCRKLLFFYSLALSVGKSIRCIAFIDKWPLLQEASGLNICICSLFLGRQDFLAACLALMAPLHPPLFLLRSYYPGCCFTWLLLQERLRKRILCGYIAAFNKIGIVSREAEGN